MTIRYAGRTEPGCVRNHNEDNLYVNGSCREAGNERFSCADSGNTEMPAVFAVCDGIGGAKHGELASAIAVQCLKGSTVYQDQEEILQMILKTNRTVCTQLGIRNGLASGTTFAGLQLQQQKFSVWNVGDSRVYLLRDGVLRRMTKDHTQGQHMIDAGLIGEEDAERSPARHVLTQYIGIPEEEFLLSPQIIAKAGLRPGDRFLLCSDGLYDMVAEPQIGAVMHKCADPQAAVDQLIQSALAAGGKDNVTAIIVDFIG